MRIQRKSMLHVMFWIGICFKAIDGVLETAGGVALLIVTKQYIRNLVLAVFRHELLEDPNDPIVHFVLKYLHGMSVDTQKFAAVYLLAHGLVKLGLAASIFSRKLWAYPLAAVVLSLLVIYQSIRFLSTHSILLLLLTLIDVGIIALIWPEYRRASARRKLPQT